MKTTPFIKKLYPFALLAALALPAGNAWAQEETPETASPGGESPPPETMAEPMPQEGQDEEMAVELEEFVFVGSRRQDRSVADSPVPVDVIDGEDFATQGYTDMDSMLSTVIPSYNVNTQPISDAATFVRPANLRGLPPDSTLVLINGKRRHRASVITFLGGGVSDGSQGPDLASIPYIALQRVEVLRDGASAQYGSDAIAGVLNFVLKDDAQGGRVETRWGQYYEDDGASWTIAANAGMPLMRQGEQNGFANFSIEYTESQSTIRSVQRADAQALIDAGLPVREPYAQIWGSPDVEYDYKFFGNIGIDLGDRAQLYIIPSFAKRKVEGGFFFRNPTNRGGIWRGPNRFALTHQTEAHYEANSHRGTFYSNKRWIEIPPEEIREELRAEFRAEKGYIDSEDLTMEQIDHNKAIDEEIDGLITDGLVGQRINQRISGEIESAGTYPTVKVAVLDPALVEAYESGAYNTEAGEIPNEVVTINPDGSPNQDALGAVVTDPALFAFNEKFPGGFTPQFGGVVTDVSIGGGLRGELESEWNYDASAFIGQHKTEFYMRNTINPQLISHPDFINDPTRIPTNLRPGNYVETDYVLNVDFSRPFETSMFHSPLNFAAGLEYRVEEFEIEAGEEYAWWADDRQSGIAAQGFGVGSNGFPAFPPSIAGVTDRGSYAAYLDLEADVVENWLAGFALRYENYDDFGDTLNFKLASRVQIMDNFALRGSISTGFRVPSIGQTSVRNVTTEFGPRRDPNNPGQIVYGLRDKALLPASEIPPQLDAQELEEETSVNFSIGTAFNFGELDVTLDYYHIKVDDRIASTDPVDWPIGVANPRNYTAVSWFANGFDTTTQGIDLVASYPIIEHSVGATVLTFAGNFSNTEVDRVGTYLDASGKAEGEAPDVKQYVQPQRVDQLENALPDMRLTLSATHMIGPWRVLLPRLRYYSSFVEYTANSGGWKVDASPRLLVDAEVEYTFDNGVSLALGAQNLFDTYPERSHPGASAGVGTLYPESSPYGFNGGFYYLKAAYTF